MCGFVGLVSKSQIDPAVIRGATEVLKHRGPDDIGIYLSTDSKQYAVSTNQYNVGLGHCRLSIIDLSPAAHQPMCNEDGTVWVVYNGEIYNFVELKKSLEDFGHKFKSKSDTEVVLHAYEQWGAECVNRFRGMFAFGIWDGKRKQLFCARDRLGIKPLYYAKIDGGFAFASEIKALLMLPGVKREPSLDVLGRYLSFLWVPEPQTFFKGIYKLLPGHTLVLKDNDVRIDQYWDLSFMAEKRKISEKEWQEDLYGHLSDAVRSHLVSDVPLGVFLSGGVDSSSVCAIMDQNGVGEILTYSVGFGKEGLKYDIVPDDLIYSRMVRDHLKKIDYHEILVDPEVVSLWPKLVWHLDEPVADPAAISTYLISKAAKERATVMLSGMGGDEIFVGYPRYLAVKLSSIQSSMPRLLDEGIIKPLINQLPASRPGRFMTLFRNLKKLSKGSGLPPHKRYFSYSSYYDQAELEQLMNAGILTNNVFEKHLGYLERVKDCHIIDQMTYMDIKTFLPDLNLAYTDKASMAASVEVRVPLLDHKLVEFVATMPPNLKMKHLTRKYIFKKTVEKLLPREVVWRKKAGFGAPVRKWVMADLKPMINDLLSETNVTRRGMLKYDGVKKILNDQWTGREDNALRIWALLTLELWFQTFIDRDGSKPIS